MTNTDRLIKSLELGARAGNPTMTFMVGKYTGNGTSVVAALRRRGYRVDAIGGSNATYRLHAKTTTARSQA